MRLRQFLIGALFALGAATMGFAAQAEILLRADASAPGRIDPHRVTDYASSMLAFNIYDTLVEPAPGPEGVAPSLAQSWDFSDDGLSVTFQLRPAVKFHSGEELSAEDVVFSMDRILALNAGYARLFQGITANADDDMTVTFTLPEPNATFLASLVRLPIVDKATVMANLAEGDHGEAGDYGDAYLSARDAGSGAYIVAEHNPQEETVLRRFEDYFGEFAENAPDVVRIRYSVEPATIRTLMAQREWEITSQWHPIEVKRALGEMDGISIVMEKGFSYFIMPLNAQRAPTDDVHFRRAIANAIDYESLLELMQVTPEIPTAQAMPGTIPSGMLGHDQSLPVLTRNLDVAREELAKSRYAENPPTLDVIWVAEVPVEEHIGLVVQQSLSEIGIPVNLTRVPWTLLTQQVSTPETTPNVTQRFVQAPFPDPDSLISQNNHSRFKGTTLKMDWLVDEDVDRMLDKARAELDPEARAAIYREIQLRVLDTMPTIYAFQTSDSFAKQDYVTAPGLEDESKTVAVQGGNFKFRTFSVNN